MKIKIMKRSIKDYLIIALKGAGMGAADVVPGVSGGTIAFITGIYEELILSIQSINITSLKLLFRFKIKDFLEAINAKFLLSLLLGIGISVLSLAKILKLLLETQPILIWSFFFGLIAASTILIGKKIQHKNFTTFLSIIIGALFAYFITSASPAETSNAYWFIFLSGSIAICAMILPGISGAFILLLLSKYHFIISALSEFKIAVLGIFAAGAITGIISFSNLLGWLLKKYHNTTIAVLTGFMCGSLNKVWPWKQTVETFIDKHGNIRPLVQENVLPSSFSEITGQPSQLMWAISLAVAGFLFIWIIESLSSKYSK